MWKYELRKQKLLTLPGEITALLLAALTFVGRRMQLSPQACHF